MYFLKIDCVLWYLGIEVKGWWKRCTYERWKQRVVILKFITKKQTKTCERQNGTGPILWELEGEFDFQNSEQVLRGNTLGANRASQKPVTSDFVSFVGFWRTFFLVCGLTWRLNGQHWVRVSTCEPMWLVCCRVRGVSINEMPNERSPVISFAVVSWQDVGLSVRYAYW